MRQNREKSQLNKGKGKNSNQISELVRACGQKNGALKQTHNLHSVTHTRFDSVSVDLRVSQRQLSVLQTMEMPLDGANTADS